MTVYWFLNNFHFLYRTPNFSINSTSILLEFHEFSEICKNDPRIKKKQIYQISLILRHAIILCMIIEKEILLNKLWAMVDIIHLYDITPFRRSKMWMRLWNHLNAIVLFLFTQIYPDDVFLILLHVQDFPVKYWTFSFSYSSLGCSFSMLLDFSKNCLLISLVYFFDFIFYT